MEERAPSAGSLSGVEAGEEDKWAARQIATRFYEHHRQDPSYTHERLRADVEVALEGQGKRISATEMQWAIEPFTMA